MAASVQDQVLLDQMIEMQAVLAEAISLQKSLYKQLSDILKMQSDLMDKLISKVGVDDTVPGFVDASPPVSEETERDRNSYQFKKKRRVMKTEQGMTGASSSTLVLGEQE